MAFLASGVEASTMLSEGKLISTLVPNVSTIKWVESCYNAGVCWPDIVCRTFTRSMHRARNRFLTG